eukprot:g1348.t1
MILFFFLLFTLVPLSQSESAHNKEQVGPLLVPISYGELLDKITILGIKLEVAEEGSVKWSHAKREFDLLNVKHTLKDDGNIADLYAKLDETNRKLWDIEDKIRDLERAQDFGDKFIETARSVYFTNDERARLKREINRASGSSLTEVKLYADYTPNASNLERSREGGEL